MAILAISKTISSAHMTRAVAALRAHFGMSDSATAAQVQNEWEKMVLAQLKGIVQDFERHEASTTAAVTVTEIALT